MLTIESTLTMNDGRRIPRLAFGVWQIPEGRTCEAAVAAALEAGYRHIDTAAIYGNERSVGRAIRDSGIPREDVFITTKLWNDHHADPARALNGSLRRLGVDSVDLYLIHYPVRERNHSWKVLETLRSDGRARSIGVSNFTIRHLEGLPGAAPAVNQVEFHPFLFQQDLLAYCRSRGILLAAYSPLTHGRRLKDRRLAAVAQRYGRSPAQILIRWCLQHDLIVIPKSQHPERIRENASVYDFHISDEDMVFLNGLNEDLRTCWDPTNEP